MRITNPETHTDRNFDVLTNTLQVVFHIRHINLGRTSHTFQGHIIHIALGQSGDLGNALVRGRGREQENSIHALLGQQTSEILGLLRWVIYRQHAVHTRLASHHGKFGLTDTFNRIGVTHQDNRRFLVDQAKLLHNLQHFTQADTTADGTFSRLLNHRTIGRRIRKRHTQFNDICPGLTQGMHQGHGSGHRRVTGRNIRHQGAAPVQTFKRLFQTHITRHISSRLLTESSRRTRRPYACPCRHDRTS